MIIITSEPVNTFGENLSLCIDHTVPAEARLHAEDVSQPADRQADPPRQLQLVLQETSHLFRVDDVAEHPDLRPLPLDVGVARWQPGAPDRPAQSLPHLFDVSSCPTVVLTDDPFGPLVEVEPVDRQHVKELLGQRLGALQQNSFLIKDAPGPSNWRVCDGEAIFMFLRWRSGDLSVW